MGLYPINCPNCNEPFMWFSGSASQLCMECLAETIMNDHKELFESLAKAEEEEKKK